MQTLQDELTQLEVKFAAKKRETETKYKILAALHNIADGYKEPSIYCHSLYGSVGCVKFEHDYWAYKANFKQPDAALLRALLAAFPPDSKTMYRDGCLSFRPSVSVSDEMEAKATECLDICPVTIDLELYQHQTASVEWFARIEGELWRFEVEFPLYASDLGTTDIQTKRDPRGRVYEYTRCQFQARHGAQVVRFASGGPEYPNKFTLWWDVDTGKATDFAAIVVKAVQS